MDPSSARLARLVLRAADPGALRAFYVEALGMAAAVSGSGAPDRSWCLGYGGDSVIELCPVVPGPGAAASRYRHSRDDLYWKIGITLPDVVVARDRLRARGVAVGEARQFRDVGFLCHLEDPEGFQVELLQHRFAANHRPVAPDPAFVLGGRPTLGQVTLRVRDIAASLRFYREGLGLRLLSVQPVASRGFTLYFLAATEERPPDPDLAAVANREWLWQRRYTTLELQHLEDRRQPLRHDDDGAVPGFAALVFVCQDPDGCLARLRSLGHRPLETTDPSPDASSRVWRLTDPDGAPVALRSH